MLPEWCYRLPPWAFAVVAFSPGYLFLALPGIASGFWGLALGACIFWFLITQAFVHAILWIRSDGW